MALERKVLPTKINLIRLRREYRAIRRIRRVLEEKRDVLLLYIRQSIDEYEESYKKVSEALMRAYEEFMMASAEAGFDPIHAFARTVSPELRVDIQERVLFAVRVPALNLKHETIPKVLPSPLRTVPRLVFARKLLIEGLESMLKLAETEIALRKLINELRETQRLINAIDNQIIPRYEKTIKYIKLVLDERMREEVIRLKMLKRKLAVKRR
ncbi:V-type ATPase, D subunit [Pyrolobus fumarii 1A]|uniref:A-type ATP synthase subunit D n=1 Tax=Pyrolobus fumarii (strain DSM 11204 / 1A) TaxID=694429 RepID=G0EDN5_PYRF1|nr:V-type ATP synthase subunit D [Pyrolobus fumarii]AEM39839.1 V-type ATPase, D subunit [Pyrolobus fumarii 1A]